MPRSNFVPLLLLLLCSLANTAAASTETLVLGVQMPAWLERGPVRTPLAAGTKLRDNDVVITGNKGRLLARAADGGLVKLGENARLKLGASSRQVDGLPGFSALLEVARGAFRYTTAKIMRRNVTVRIASVTIGIRGTDVWGKGDANRDIVVLLEGKISLQREGDAPITLDQPLTHYVAPKGAHAQPVMPVNADELKIWAQETEITPGQGATKSDGRFRAQVGTFDTQDTALAQYDKLRGAGYAARIRPVATDKLLVYAVEVAGLPTQAEAKILAERLKMIAGSER